MANDKVEEDLLRSIEEVEVRIRSFRRRVRAVLADIQSEAPEAQSVKEVPSET